MVSVSGKVGPRTTPRCLLAPKGLICLGKLYLVDVKALWLHSQREGFIMGLLRRRRDERIKD